VSAIAGNRDALDSALNDGRLVVVLFFGESNSRAQEVHDFAEANIKKQWWRTFILRSDVALTGKERAAWGGVADTYVALTKSRQLNSKGNVVSLYNQDGTVSVMKVRPIYDGAGAAP